MDQVRKTLGELLPWLRKRCDHQARRFGQDQSWADDLFQKAVELFLDRTAKGWFDQQPRTALRAQAITLLHNNIRQAWTHMLRKDREELWSGKPDDEGESHEPELVDEATTRPLEEVLGWEQVRDRARQLAHRLANPGRRLALLALVYPDDVERDHFAAAADGRRAFLKREVDPAWKLYAHFRRDDACRSDETRWKRTLAEVLRSPHPFGETPRAELLRGVNMLEASAGRATREIQLALESMVEEWR